MFQIAPKSISNAVVGRRGQGGDLWFNAETLNPKSRSQQYTIVGNAKRGYLIRLVERDEVLTCLGNNELRPMKFDPTKASSQRWYFSKA